MVMNVDSRVGKTAGVGQPRQGTQARSLSAICELTGNLRVVKIVTKEFEEENSGGLE